jgi:hypothetical protein
MWIKKRTSYKAAQIKATSMMSSVEQPRDKSKYGLLKPCTIGPIALAPPIL